MPCIRPCYKTKSLSSGISLKTRYALNAFLKVNAKISVEYIEGDQPIEHINVSLKKCIHSYSYVGHNENLGLEHNFGQSLEMRNRGVYLYFMI